MHDLCTLENPRTTFYLYSGRTNSTAISCDFGLSIIIQTTIPKYAGSGRLQYFPKTLFTENSTVFDVVSENYPYSPDIDKGRLALEVVVIHGENVQNGSVSLSKSSDDEYTPSVFTTYTYSAGGNHSMGGYAQWKPISYQSAGRKSTESQQVAVVPTAHVDECEVLVVPRGLASALMGSNISSETVGNVTRWLVVFGTPGDENYINSAYNTW